MASGGIRTNAFVALRLPSDTIVVTQIKPNATISIGKYGAFQANHIIGRPYHVTYEIIEKPTVATKSTSGLRIVPSAELYSESNDEEASTAIENGVGGPNPSDGGVEYDIVGEDGEVVTRTNRQIIDDPASQIMTMDDIEALKAQGTCSGKELIAKIIESHSALDQKTAFALAKYTLRKTKKYLKRFTVLPLDVPMLAQWVLTEKEPLKIMEMREEILALIGSWSNVHCTPADSLSLPIDQHVAARVGRWLVIDETAGLLVAYMAEKMGILYPDEPDVQSTRNQSPPGRDLDELDADVGHAISKSKSSDEPASDEHYPHPHKARLPSSTNTITLLHANAQPNLSLLKYFHFDAFDPKSSHPLSDHLKTLSWLQLLAPDDDAGYTEPEALSEDVMKSWKSGKRSNYFRKRRRWERIKFVVDEIREGGFDGLIIASVMNPTSILRHTIPLLGGAAQVVVYSPTIESLVELADNYSSGRRTAFITNPPDPEIMPTEDFPVDPTLLLAPTIQSARCRSWQVLPGRTHPFMTGRGGSEGYVFTATRVLPAEGKVEARGKFKRRKVDGAPMIGSSYAPRPSVMTHVTAGNAVADAAADTYADACAAPNAAADADAYANACAAADANAYADACAAADADATADANAAADATADAATDADACAAADATAAEVAADSTADV